MDRANEKVTALGVRLANEAARFNGLDLDYDDRRKLDKFVSNFRTMLEIGVE